MEKCIYRLHHCILAAKVGINFLQLGSILKVQFELESPFDYVCDSLMLLWGPLAPQLEIWGSLNPQMYDIVLFIVQ